MKLRLVVTLAGLLTLTAGCATGGSRADGPKVFGEQPESCPATALSNGGGGDQNAEEHADCFMAEFEAGRSVVWDVVVSTVEGDPIPIRYEFDGEVVTITTDSSFDTFGSGEVDVQVCDGVRRADRLLKESTANPQTVTVSELTPCPEPVDRIRSRARLTGGR